MEYITSDEPSISLMKNNAAVLSRSDRALLHIVRAFIANPEVLVIHNPTQLLDGSQRQVCLKALRAFVDERGLEMPVETRAKRRPRTVIYSTSNIDGVKIADQILYCRNQKVLFKDLKEVEDLFSAGAETLSRRESKASETLSRRGSQPQEENVKQSTVVPVEKPSARGDYATQEAVVAEGLVRCRRRLRHTHLRS